ncbi:MAG: ECF-type sigma factor [Planctomycetes bacterium]|nr:ECF-type sigma factor [Planctomycetota bacterium]
MDASDVVSGGDGRSVPSTEELFDELYRSLRAMAERFMQGERGDHTLQATALVHEAYLRLTRQGSTAWDERGRFLGVAARTMRRALCDHARAKLSLRRDGAGDRLAVDVDDLEALRRPGARWGLASPRLSLSGCRGTLGC